MSFFSIIQNQKFDVAFYQVFVGARLHVTGGALRGGRLVDGEAAVAGKLFILYCYHLERGYIVIFNIFSL